LGLTCSPRIGFRQSIKNLLCCTLYLTVVKAKPTIGSAASPWLNALPLIRVEIQSADLSGRNMLTPVCGEASIRTARDLNYEPASPLVELERKQVDRARDRMPKVRKCTPESFRSQQRDYNLPERCIHGFARIVCHEV